MSFLTVLEIKNKDSLYRLLRILEDNDFSVVKYRILESLFDKNIRVEMEIQADDGDSLEDFLEREREVIDIIILKQLNLELFLDSVVIKSLSDIENIFKNLESIDKRSLEDPKKHVWGISSFIYSEFDDEAFLDKNYDLRVLVQIISNITKNKDIKYIVVPTITPDDFINAIIRYFSWYGVIFLYSIDDSAFSSIITHKKKEGLLDNAILYQYDVLPVSIVAHILDLSYRFDIDLNNLSIGIIGISQDILSLLEIFETVNFSKILGYDPADRYFIPFEKRGGIVTNIEYILESSDIVIIRDIGEEEKELIKNFKGKGILNISSKRLDIPEDKNYMNVNPNVLGALILSVFIDFFLEKGSQFSLSTEVKKRIAYKIFDLMEDGNLYYIERYSYIKESLSDELFK